MTEEPEKLSESLMHSVINDYSASALIELSESLLDEATDSLVKSEVLTKIPVLGVLVGLTRGVFAFRDRRYASKILSFLAETSKASEDDKARYRKKLDKSPDEVRKAGETVLDIIDKITNAEKAVMMGKIFRAYMHEDDLTTEQLIYLCEIIERTYLQDLISLQKSEIHNDVNLESVGIKKPLRVEDVDKAIADALSEYDNTKERNTSLVSKSLSPVSFKVAKIPQSGLTDAGFNLTRILRSY